jgi:hypothetical protein
VLNSPRQTQVSIERLRSSVYRMVTKVIEGVILLMFELAEFGDMTLGSVLRLRCKISGYSHCGHQITLWNLPKSHQICCCHLTLRSLTKIFLSK